MIMLDTNHCLSIEPSPPGSPPMANDMEKAALKMDHDRLVYHSLKEGGRSGVTHRQWRHEIFLYVLCLCASVDIFSSVLCGFI